MNTEGDGASGVSPHNVAEPPTDEDEPDTEAGLAEAPASGEPDSVSQDSPTDDNEDDDVDERIAASQERRDSKGIRLAEAPASGDSPHSGAEPRTDDNDDDADGASGDSRHNDEEPPTDRLLRRRAELVEQRRVIMFGKARDDIAREIERIDRRLVKAKGPA